MTQIPLGSLSLNADRKLARSHVLDIAEKKLDDSAATYQYDIAHLMVLSLPTDRASLPEGCTETYVTAYLHGIRTVL